MPMTSYPALALTSALAFAALLLLQLAAFAVGRKIGRFNVVDVTWGAGLALVGVVALAVRATGLAGAAPPDWVAVSIAAAAAVWGVRLAVHVARKTAGHGEDLRYAEMLGRLGAYRDDGSVRPLVVLRSVFLLQAGAQWIISLPLQAIGGGDAPGGAAIGLVAAGLAVWGFGFVFEAVGDAQLAAFKADPDRPRIMDRGLWAWTRHPNYFGDACVWWGTWLASLATVPAVWTIVSPLLMTYLLVWGSGARLLEKSMSKREGWEEYARRTSFFVPRPPRRDGS